MKLRLGKCCGPDKNNNWLLRNLTHFYVWVWFLLSMSKQVVAELGQTQVKLEVTVEVGFEVGVKVEF